MAGDNWGRKFGENYHRRQRSQSRRPLPSWKLSVPSWEKKFCASMAVPWYKLLEMKKFVYLHQNVVKWNDSAGEEAFWNAKKRFWAAINGLPCDMKFPGPDIYIDEIDWNAEIDPELLLDLEREFVVPNNAEQEGGIVNLAISTEPILSTGWGDNEDELQGDARSHSQPQIIGCNNHAIKGEDPWECGYFRSHEGVKESGGDHSRGWNGWGHDAVKENHWDSFVGGNEWDNSVYFSDNRTGQDFEGAWRRSCRKKETTVWYPSGGRGGMKKRPEFVYQQPPQLLERTPPYGRW
ncbi:hypothetical protein Nepgr_022019 [Nepenthes gracilis]|uniref:Uncharacterized protein n=1 Tax=Nepenthes gracilis TaxID=150966 RepID=A0AAD3SXU2_NEPGR|nr:hypothetical protein Nepgr_022019 [Nepenthes gracilis]